MKMRSLGSTGLTVGAVGLGAMPLSLAGRPDERAAVRVVHAALDAGITLIDTANAYCVNHTEIGHNERLLARALREWQGAASDVVIATKGGIERPDGAWVTNGRPEHLVAACEASLAALGVEAITLYQLHAPDREVPFADSVGALAELQRQGKIQHVGLSNVTVAEIREARRIVEVASVQNRCNPLERGPLADGVVAICEAKGVAFLPYSPVGGSYGVRRVASSPTLRRVGARHDATPFQVALAWLLAKSPAMLPIPGASRIESAVSSAAAADLELDAEDLAELDAAFPV